MLSRSVLAQLAPSAPLAGTSRLHRRTAYTRCLRCAGAPRRPASGSGLSLPFRPDMPSSLTPGSSTSHVSSVAMPTRPSPRSERLGTPNTPAIRFTRDPLFEASLVRVCYGLSGCSPPWADRTKFPWPTGDFYIQASGGSVALPAAGYDYNSTGLLCWRDFHPQEWQLASLHRIYSGSRPWTQVHARWLSNLSFEHPAQYPVLREYRQAIADAETRLERLAQQVAEVVGSWSMAPVVEAYQSMRGVAFLTAVTFVAEIGDVRRFENPRQLIAYLRLVPSERSTGAQVWRGPITKAGNPRARRVLIEGAWTYRYPARLSRPLQVRQESLSTVVRAIAWKAQLRLCARYRRLMAAGKRQTVVTTAIAREMAAFLWAIGHAVEPRPAA